MRAYVCDDMRLSVRPVITTSFPFSRFLFSLRPSYVSVHVGFMYHKHFFLLTIQRCSDMGLVEFVISICFPLSSVYFLIYFQSSDIFISIWDLTICHNHVWSMKGPKSGKQTLMYLFVPWPDTRNHICVFFDFILMFSSAGVPRLFRSFNVPPLFFFVCR